MLQNFFRQLRNSTKRYYAATAATTTSTSAITRPLGNNAIDPKAPSPLISCKRPQYNQLVPAKPHTKFGDIALASHGWMHDRSKGDYFTINPLITTKDLESTMEPLDEFLTRSQINISPELLQNLKEELGVKRLTHIQAHGIPAVYDGQHTLIAAETGCGKTLVYLLPIVQKVLQMRQSGSPLYFEGKLNSPLAVIITPGRELASQIGGVAEMLCKSTDLKVKTLLGGNTKRLMVNPTFEDIDILVATIGALSKLVTTGIYRMDEVQHVVLDEADTLLDDSFNEKLCHFLKKFPFHKNASIPGAGTQMILASATMPTNANEMLTKVIDVQTVQEVISPNLHMLMSHVKQKFLRMAKANRPGKLLEIVKSDLIRKRPVIIFSNKSATSDYVSIFLNNNGVNCLNLNGDMLMKIRMGRFEQFQRGNCDVLSTTDVGSRGLDTKRARHVVNFDFPLHIADYIHRCGRIGRVGHCDACMVTNFVSSRREVEIVQKIEHSARTGGLLPNVNANIRGIINKQIMSEIKKAESAINEEAF